jgi:hypothetical protein
MNRSDFAARAEDFRVAFTCLIASERVPGGFRWVFSRYDGFEETLRGLAAREHDCCSFVTFKLFAEGEHLIWETTGPEDAQQAIDFFYSLPESVDQDVATMEREAERSGLLSSADESAKR